MSTGRKRDEHSPGRVREGGLGTRRTEIDPTSIEDGVRQGQIWDRLLYQASSGESESIAATWPVRKSSLALIQSRTRDYAGSWATYDSGGRPSNGRAGSHAQPTSAGADLHGVAIEAGAYYAGTRDTLHNPRASGEGEGRKTLLGELEEGGRETYSNRRRGRDAINRGSRVLCQLEQRSRFLSISEGARDAGYRG